MAHQETDPMCHIFFINLFNIKLGFHVNLSTIQGLKVKR